MKPKQNAQPASLDLNCDLGEGESSTRTRALMRCITSANIACGGHAGSIRSMESAVRLAQEFRVRLGAHPGPWDRSTFGRASATLSPDDLEALVFSQTCALERIARSHGIEIHHIKLHGALYHATDTNPLLARRYLHIVARWWPQAVIFARAGGQLAQLARFSPIQVWEEIFADRAYRDDGSLVPRAEPKALLSRPGHVLERIQHFLQSGAILSRSGKPLLFSPRTLCLHSDTPHALQIAQTLSQLINANASTR